MGVYHCEIRLLCVLFGEPFGELLGDLDHQPIGELLGNSDGAPIGQALCNLIGQEILDNQNILLVN